MANPSKLTLYVAGAEIGYGLKTKIQARVVVSNEQLKTALQENDNVILQRAESASNVVKAFEGKVRMPASLDMAIDFLVDYVIPMAAILRSKWKHFAVEVMFNDPAITSAVKNKYLDKWRENNFQFKKTNNVKVPIPNGNKWATLDETLRRINGSIVTVHDNYLRDMVDKLKNSTRKKRNADDGDNQIGE